MHINITINRRKNQYILGILRFCFCGAVVYGFYSAAYHTCRKATGHVLASLCVCRCLYIFGASHHQCRYGSGHYARHRNTVAFLQLRWFVLMGIYFAAVYSDKVGRVPYQQNALTAHKYNLSKVYDMMDGDDADYLFRVRRFGHSQCGDIVFIHDSQRIA